MTPANVIHLPLPATDVADLVSVDDAELQVLRQILAMVLVDAIEHRTPPYCDDCMDAGGECAGHAADLDRTDDYLRLAAALGIDLDEVDEPGLEG